MLMRGENQYTGGPLSSEAFYSFATFILKCFTTKLQIRIGNSQDMHDTWEYNDAGQVPRIRFLGYYSLWAVVPECKFNADANFRPTTATPAPLSHGH